MIVHRQKGTRRNHVEFGLSTLGMEAILGRLVFQARKNDPFVLNGYLSWPDCFAYDATISVRAQRPKE